LNCKYNFVMSFSFEKDLSAGSEKYIIKAVKTSGYDDDIAAY